MKQKDYSVASPLFLRTVKRFEKEVVKKSKHITKSEGKFCFGFENGQKFFCSGPLVEEATFHCEEI
jgi:hypothetical protein